MSSLSQVRNLTDEPIDGETDFYRRCIMSTIYFDKPLRLTEAQAARAYNFIDVRIDCHVNYLEIKGRTLIMHGSSTKGCKVTIERYFGKLSAEDEAILYFIINGCPVERVDSIVIEDETGCSCSIKLERVEDVQPK